MIVVDSSVWIDHFIDRSDEPTVRRLRTLFQPDRIIVGDLILLELLRGARDEHHAGRMAALLQQFGVRPMLNGHLAMIAARFYRALRGRGITVRKTADLVIATYCITEGHSLLTKDGDFGPFAEYHGLVLV